MTKIDIISGFLGAGKTTLIKKLIEEALKGQKVVLIENEFGEIGIDGGFLKESGIQINEMNSGCICCSLVGDFNTALKDVLEQYTPDRIIIEPSGVGKLSDVMKAVIDVSADMDVALNSAVTIVDAAKCKMYMKNFGEFYDDQISHASCIILSRTQNATEEKIAAAVAMLREKNPTATIVTTAWDALTGEQILKAMSTKDDFKAELIAMAAKANEEHAHEDEEEEHEHHHHHHADEVFTSWGQETVKTFTKEQIEGILKKLSEDTAYGMVLRAKGMVAGADGQWIYFDMVPEEYEVRDGAPEFTGRICVIGSKLAEDKLAELFGL